VGETQALDRARAALTEWINRQDGRKSVVYDLVRTGLWYCVLRFPGDDPVVSGNGTTEERAIFDALHKAQAIRR
jgi:hypothetical protein